ncbi:interferon-related developmental regulator-domain-containing protein [Pilobolus umbonatus]|nr:interferon-related developmental regulator-domain-containing protein [Pilobolus umbonatus]
MPSIPKRTHKPSHKSHHEEQPETSGSGWPQKLNEAIDNLSENRTSIREEALGIIVDTLACQDVSAEIDNRLEELLGLLKKSITKNGSTKEATLASKAVALTFINMGNTSAEEEDDLYTRILPCLRNTAQNSEELEIKVSCLNALTVITYIAASDAATQSLRDYLFDIIETDAVDFNVGSLSSHECDLLFAEALKSYGILFASSFGQGAVNFDEVWEEVEKVLPIHELLLESADKDIRIASGENIALMFEIVHIFTQQDEDEEEIVEYPEYDNMDGLIHTLKQLSVDSSRQRSKSDKVVQKSVFRDIIRSVDENIKPVEELKIGDRVISFRGWAKILALNLFRRCLGKGLQYQLKTNAMFKQMFRYGYQHTSDNDSSMDMPLSNVDRKYLHEENKKSRSRNIRAARSGKDADTY